MIRSLLFIITILFQTLILTAQTPEAFKYQAVVRGASGQILANQAVSFRISLLQGGTSGTSVYFETHAANTNAFGLVNLSIGNGVVGSGDFSAIDWGADTYYVQIELDENGGSVYEIMGAAQLLSVPYALHAKTAENFPLDADADPTNEIELPEGGANGQVLSTDGSGNYSWINNGGASTTYSVGDFAHGGVVFWVDESGAHGLVCAIEDQFTGPWYNGTYLDTKAMRIGVYGGAINTERITDIQGSINYAAFICSQYDGGAYGDWYLPSKGELNLMFQNRATINTTAAANGGEHFNNDDFAIYWSSTEFDQNNAWAQNFSSGNQGELSKEISTLSSARAVRAF